MIRKHRLVRLLEILWLKTAILGLLCTELSPFQCYGFSWRKCISSQEQWRRKYKPDKFCNPPEKCPLLFRMWQMQSSNSHVSINVLQLLELPQKNCSVIICWVQKARTPGVSASRWSVPKLSFSENPKNSFQAGTPTLKPFLKPKHCYHHFAKN